MSTMDTFGLEPSAFVCNGSDIIEAAKTFLQGQSSLAIKREEMQPSVPESSPFFKPKRFRCQPYEPQ